MNATSPCVVFVVSERTGDYDYRQSYPVKVFTDKSDAERFMATKKEALLRLETMREVVTNLLRLWEESNPPPNQDTFSVGETKYDIWQDQRGVELERLEKVTGYTAARHEVCPNQDESEVGYYMTELPLT